MPPCFIVVCNNTSTSKLVYDYISGFQRVNEDKKRVRVAGPFTVESLSPHRVLGVDEDDELIDTLKEGGAAEGQDFASMILENLKIAGVQQAHKDDRIVFTSLTAWPGYYLCAEGRYLEGETEKRAGIFIGPEFGTVNKPDLVAAAKECGEAGFDVLIACAFNYEAHTTEGHPQQRHLPALRQAQFGPHRSEGHQSPGR